MKTYQLVLFKTYDKIKKIRLLSLILAMFLAIFIYIPVLSNMKNISIKVGIFFIFIICVLSFLKFILDITYNLDLIFNILNPKFNKSGVYFNINMDILLNDNQFRLDLEELILEKYKSFINLEDALLSNNDNDIIVDMESLLESEDFLEDFIEKIRQHYLNI